MVQKPCGSLSVVFPFTQPTRNAGCKARLSGVVRQFGSSSLRELTRASRLPVFSIPLCLGAMVCSAQQISVPVPSTINAPVPTLSSAEPVQMSTRETVSLSTGAVNFFLPVVSFPQRGGGSLQLAFLVSGSSYQLKEPYNAFQDLSNADDAYNDLAPTRTTIQNAPTNSPPFYTAVHTNIPSLTADLSYAGMDTHNAGTDGAPHYITNPEYCMQNWTFTDWDESSHSFPGTKDCSMGGGVYYRFSETIPLNKVTSQSEDDSFYILDATGQDIRVIKRDGTVYHFPMNNAGYVQPLSMTASDTNDYTQLYKYAQFFTSTVDVNGNTISYANGVLTDTIGRRITLGSTNIAYTAMAGGNTTSTTQATSVSFTPAQTTAPWPVTYPSQTTTTSAGPCTVNYVAPNRDAQGPPQLTYQGPGVGSDSVVPWGNVYTITLPNEAVYTLTFDGPGNIIKVKYPSGGYTKYDYQYGRLETQTNFQDVSCILPSNELLAKHECSQADGACAPASTVTTAGSCVAGYSNGGEATTCYSGLFGALPSTASFYGGATASVIDPDGRLSVHVSVGNQSISSGNPNSPTYTTYIGYIDVGETDYAGSTTNSAVVKSVTKSLGDQTTGCASANPFLLSPCDITTTYTTASGSVSSTVKMQYDWPRSNNLTAIQEYDFNGTLLKTTTATWNSGGIYSAGSAGTTGPSNMLDHLASITSTDNIQNKSNQKVFTYDAKGNLTQSQVTGTQIPTLTTSYTPLDAFGRPTQMTDPNGNITKFGYDDAWYENTCAPSADAQAYLTSITNAKGQTNYYQYDSCTGELGSSTDPNQQVTSFAYDNMGRTKLVNYPDGGWDKNEYTDIAPLVIHSTRAQAPSPNITKNTIFDGFSRVSQTQLLSNPLYPVYVDTTYDPLGRMASVSNPYFYGFASSSDGTTTFQYDAIGRKILQQEPDGNLQQWCFNGIADTHHAQSNCRPNQGGFAGIWTDKADEAGNNWQRGTNAAGQLIGVIEPNGSLTSYGYDGFNNLVSVTQTGSSGTLNRGFGYDGLSRLVSSQNPESGTVTYAYLVNGQLCAGDASLPCSKTDANGMTISYGYDALNRLLSKSAPDIDAPPGGFSTSNLTYDEGLNGIGRLTSEFRDGVAGESYSYDAMGRVTGPNWFDYSAHGWRTGITTKYDLAGNVTQLTYPDQRVISQAWDGAGRLAAVWDSTGGVVGSVYATGPSQPSNGTGIVGSPCPNGVPNSVTSCIHHAASGVADAVLYGNAATLALSFNNRLQPCHEAASTPLLGTSSSGGNLLDRQLFYGQTAEPNCGAAAKNNGNIWSILEGVNHNTYQSFTYDSLNRLTQALSGNRPPASSYIFTYQYPDAFGNMLPIDNLHTPMNYGIDPTTNRLTLNGDVNTGDLQYYPNGALKSAPNGLGGTHTFGYTAEG